MTGTSSNPQPGLAPNAGNLGPGAPRLRASIAAIPAYVAGRRSDSGQTARLASNESHFQPLPSVLKVVQEASLTANRYPDPASIELRTALAARLDVDFAEVVVGPGSAGVLAQIISSLCSDGDEVIHPWRSFEAYPILINVTGARAVPVPLHADESHDLDAMASAINSRTRIMILCSPNNPTGVPIGAQRLDNLLTRVPSRVLVVIDEAYVEYSTNDDLIDAPALFRAHPNVAVLRTFSKAFGLAGLRVGYGMVPTALADGIRNAAVPFVVSAIAQQAATASLEATDEIRERVDTLVAERARVVQVARDLGWTVPDSEGNFIWLRVPDRVREDLDAALTSANILVRAYTGDGVRISLADQKSNDRVLDVLRAYRA